MKHDAPARRRPLAAALRRGRRPRPSLGALPNGFDLGAHPCLEMLRLILEHAPVMVSLYDKQGRTLFMNPFNRKKTGWNVSEDKAEDILDRALPDPEERALAERHMAVASGTWRRFDMRRPDGSRFSSAWKNVPVAPGLFMGVGVDLGTFRSLSRRVDRLQHWLRGFFEISPDGVCVGELDVETGSLRVLDCNDGYVLPSGRSRKEILGCENVIAHQTLVGGAEEKARVFADLAAGRRGSGVFTWLRPDGGTNFIEFSSILIGGRERPRLVGITRDVTRETLRMRDLSADQVMFREMVAHFPFVIWSMDLKGKITLSEGRGLERAGMKPGNAVGLSVFDLCPGDAGQEALYRKALAGAAFSAVTQYQDVFYETRFTPLFEKDGRLKSVLGVSRDVTDQVFSERALEETLARFRKLTENMEEGFFLVRPGSLEMVHASASLHQILGLNADSAPKGSLCEYLEQTHPLDAEQTFARLAEMAAGREVSTGLFRIVRPDGAVRWIEIRCYPVPDGRGQTLHMAGFVKDVTEARNYQRRIRRLTGEIMQAQEGERKRISRELHDGLCQDLCASKLALEQIVTGLKEGGAADVSDLEGVAERLREGIDEIRRIIADLRPMILDELGLVAALAWLASRFRQENPSISLRTDLPDGGVRVAPSAGLAFFRIAQAALSNVARHSRASRAAMRLSREGENLCLEIRDNGCGFDPGLVLDVQIFWSSLGLRSARERAEQAGGTLCIKSTEGRGAMLKACLPQFQTDSVEG